MFWRKKKNQKAQEEEVRDNKLLHPEKAPDIEPSTDAEDSDLDLETKHEIEGTENGVIRETPITPTPQHTKTDDAKEREDLSDHSKEGGWFSKLTSGLSKSSKKLTTGIGDIFTKKKLDNDTLEELEELLITADLGPSTAARLVETLRAERFGKDIEPEEVKAYLSGKIEEILKPVALPLELTANKPMVILVAGVNGAGKTTTIGKMAQSFKKQQGKSVMLAAGDTFRAAAVEQLQVWGERTSCKVVSKDIGADAAAVAYEAYEQAKAEGVDVLLVDTAGRLQNKKNLMEELAKIIRVLKKQDENLPHACVLVLDSTTGQNAHSQVEAFKEMVDVTGLIVTKLDGSAKGGVLVSLADQFGLPVHLIGVGEGIDDLRPFKAEDYAHSLLGIE
ncbi:MAG: signal recognition particle-docking protein FtsY [Micavibrio sp.]|nr:signal recognition particle-docking protein FtsY [Micavibrio sp.]